MLQRLLLLRSFRWVLALLSGALLVISFPYTGSCFPLAFVALIPLLLLEKTYHQRKSAALFLQLYLTFLVYNIGTTWWIYYADPGGAYMAFICNSLLMAVVFFVFHKLNKRTTGKYTFLLLVSVWISFEMLHFNWELSWPWLTLGNVFARIPEIVQWYGFTGVLGGSLWILSVNFLLFRMISARISANRNMERKQILFTASVIVVPALISLAMYASFTEKRNPYEIVLLQPNIDPMEKFGGSDEQQLDIMLGLADRTVTPQTELVMAPETALFPRGQVYEEDLSSRTSFSGIYNRRKSWGKASFLVGASTYKFFEKRNSSVSRKDPDGPGFYEFYNSSVLFDGNDKASVVHKSKLVLGVEKLPFSSIFPQIEELSINLGGSSGTLGIEDNGPSVMVSSGTAFAPVVCYESVYGDFVREQCKKGAEFIAVITNDGWWRDTPGYKQHFAFSRLRAVENRRYVARSANTGKSGFINQRGDVLSESGWWKETAMRGTIQLNDSRTVYQLTGDLIGYAAAAGFFILWGIAIKTRLRRRSEAK